MTDGRRHIVPWKQFLLARQAMLAEYDRALSHALTQPVSTHHGNVAEATVRDWLSTFLPKRFGVTSGYIRSQVLEARQSTHFDVIIYDRLDAPTLWIEENRDRSTSGRARIIPAENVRAVLEIKAAFCRRSVTKAAQKLDELAPLMIGVDSPEELYPKFLPASVLVGMLFFELRRADRAIQMPLEVIRDVSIKRPFYGAVILRGEGCDPDASALIHQTEADQPSDGSLIEDGLRGVTLTKTSEIAGQHRGAVMSWAGANFSRFAFDLLATLRGTYRHGYVSSFHGMVLSAKESEE